MKTYDVTIDARIVKTYRVVAESEDEASDAAHELFCVTHEDGVEDDRYKQETIEIQVVRKVGHE